jgi:UDP-N-acetyl-D-glucosamine dehydrogenase
LKFKSVAVIGLGYVGMPLAASAAASGHKVYGIDSDLNKLNLIKSGKSPTSQVTDLDLQKLLKANALEITDDFSVISKVQIVLICVPTPLTKDFNSDLSFLVSAIKSVAKFLEDNTLIILESTVAPGTTRNHLARIIEDESGLNLNSLGIVFSPERIDPNNSLWGLKNTPKILGGLSKEATTMAIEFYSNFVDQVIDCGSPEVAEVAKLLENSFRLVNISFINELSLFCNKIEVDILEVIKAAATKPFGFLAFYPGLGAGGHCIPVDPIYLQEKASEVGSPIRLIELASQINTDMPDHFIERARLKLGNLVGKKIIIVGIAYKPNVSDVRETPTKKLISKLRDLGAIVSWHDQLVEEWNGEKSVSLNHDFDLAIIATYHDNVDLDLLGEVPIIDTKNSI